MIEIVPNWHPIFVHFTVAMLTVSILMFFVGFTFNKSKWHVHILTVAHWNFWIGTVAAIATAIAGWLAYNTVTHDTPSHAAMTVHRNWAFGTLGILIPVAIWLAWSKRSLFQMSKLFVVSLAITFSFLSTTAWYGGELVYRYGLVVMSMPMMNESAGGHDDQAHSQGKTVKQMPEGDSGTTKPKALSSDRHNHDH